MGHASERHDLMSQETQAARWIGFRQPILRVALEKQGKKFNTTYEAHEAAGIGQVWEEDEFWIELSWRVDPDGSLGIRKHFESPYEPGKKMTVDDYYRWIFENSVPGLPEAAAKEDLTPLEYMRKYGAFLIEDNVYKVHETGIKSSELLDTATDPSSNLIFKNGNAIGVEVDGKACVGFPTPSRKLEFFSKTLKDWKWPEHAIPGYIKSHVHPDNIDLNAGEMLLLPTFRLPTLIHTRSGNAKWLYEISNRNPLWINSKDAENLEVKTGDLLKVHTEIGYFIDKVWVTEGIKPGVVACSHHHWPLALGRRSGRRALVDGAGRFETDGRGQVDDATCSRHQAVQKRRSRLGENFLGRRWRASESDVPGTARLHKRPTLLASESADNQAGAGGQIRRHLCRHQQVARSVQKMAIENPPGAWPG